MTKLKIVFLNSLILWGAASFATVGETVKISGYVISYDENIIKLELKDSEIKVPRKLYPKYLAYGHKIEVETSEEEFEKIARAAVKRKK